MNDIRLTLHHFDSSLRKTLRYKYEFDHKDLERAKGIMSDAIAHVEHKFDTKLGMKAEHLDTAMEFLNKEHAEWRKLPEHQKRDIEATLKGHFGIEEN